MLVDFDHWTNGRSVACLGTNAGSVPIPFQKWRHFKEAFAPEVVSQAVSASSRTVRTCLDPFGGSGTTALACQFLGIHPTTVEVNPYLADLIEAKLATYDCDRLISALTGTLRRASEFQVQAQEFVQGLPATFVEPGIRGRWIFDEAVASRLVQIALAIGELDTDHDQRLYRVLLGGIMLSVSNVVVNGKGRRYRRGWNGSVKRTAADVDRAFTNAATAAIGEIDRFARRQECGYRLIRGDCRTALEGLSDIDLAVFSPPYPNSFDYTDVYNVELWMLGYLRRSDENRRLRTETLASHVQIGREYRRHPCGSQALNDALDALQDVRDQLWSASIPAMIGAYFADMKQVLSQVAGSLSHDGQAWVVVGDSRYAGVKIPVARILADLAPSTGLDVERTEVLRGMRSSAQQGGQYELNESLVVLRRC